MKTKIKSKVLNFLQDLIRRESFIKTIKLLRKKYKIPEEGFPLDKRYSMGDLPKEMKSSNKNKDLKIYRNIFKDIEKEIEKKYYKDKLSLGSIIACHLFFNDMFYFVKSFSELGLILFFDLDTFFIKGDKKIKIRDTLPENIFFIGNNNYKYCILINEEVTQNELFDFIAGEYGKIKNL
ncbi:MAG: hypothetical protein RLZZ517_78, partial [Candidatus Parcubacteria bacterium]